MKTVPPVQPSVGNNQIAIGGGYKKEKFENRSCKRSWNHSYDSAPCAGIIL